MLPSIFYKEVLMSIILVEYSNMLDSLSFWLYMALLLTDIITGNIKAWVTEDVDSSVGVAGSLKHLALLGMVIILLPTLSAYMESNALSIVIVNYYSYQYTISIVENLGALGWGIPPQIANKLRRLKEDDDNGNGDGSIL